MEQNTKNPLYLKLQSKLSEVAKKQLELDKEIKHISAQMEGLKKTEVEVPASISENERRLTPPPLPKINPTHTENSIKPTQATNKRQKNSSSFDWEKLIGENILNKVGIIITIIGVSLGLKYAIDKELISPTVRLTLAYLFSGALVVAAVKLKSKYLDYSAAIFSGAMAIAYFTSFVGYKYLDIFSSATTYILMCFLAATTVWAALKYNKSVIAHIGLVGAYAVPFIISSGSDEYGALLSYILILNIGILCIAFYKYWKSLYLSAFLFTWFIFGAWVVGSFTSEEFYTKITFLSLYFIIFYSSFLIYKFKNNLKAQYTDIIIIANATVFYTIGRYILHQHYDSSYLEGFYSIFNGLIHWAVGFFLFRRKAENKNSIMLLNGLAIVFVSISVPAFVGGKWIGTIWMMEAALLFYMARKQGEFYYEKFSYPLMVGGVLSLFIQWSKSYSLHELNINPIMPILNPIFFNSVLIIGLLAFIYRIHKGSELSTKPELQNTLDYLIPIGLILLSYVSLFTEINCYWKLEIQEIKNQELASWMHNRELSVLKLLQKIWIINYSLIFFTILGGVNVNKFKNKILSVTNNCALFIFILLFLFLSLDAYSVLREYYLEGVDNFKVSSIWVHSRYLSYVFVAAAVGLLIYDNDKFDKAVTTAKEVFAYLVLTWVLSSEFIHILEMWGYENSYKFGLSIVWGVLSLLIIIIGLIQRKKHLRIASICLLGITLVKLFFYDIAAISAISKVIIFIIMGLLLLVISFYYNKFSKKIF